MTDKNTPAYPQSLTTSSDGTTYASYDWISGSGMTLHQHYAGLAMQELIALHGRDERRNDIVAEALSWADSMIAAYAEREKG